MSTYRTFAPHDQFPADFPNALGQILSSLAFNFRVNIKPGAPTILQVVAGTDLQRVAIAVQGRWRYVDAEIERASPGGTAQTFDVYVTAADNSFAISGDHEVDSTDYSFGLAIVTAGTTPSAVALYSKVAAATWNGTQFAQVTPAIPAWTPPDVDPGDFKFSAQTADHGTNPDGGGSAWLLINTIGRTVSAATYPGLWDALGKPTLTGGNFPLPSPAGRTLVAAGSGGTDDHSRTLTARTPGMTLGEEIHALLAAESGVNGSGSTGADAPDHTHPSFALVPNAGNPNNVSATSGGGWLGTVNAIQSGGAAERHAHPLTARNADSSHENMQPSLVQNCFIRT